MSSGYQVHLQGRAYTEDAGLPFFDRAAVIANGTWLCGSALKLLKLCCNYYSLGYEYCESKLDKINLKI